MSDTHPRQGDVIRVSVPKNDCRPTLTWRDETVDLLEHNKRWLGYLGVGLEADPGTKLLHVETDCEGTTTRERVRITIRPGDYPVQRLTVEDTGKVSLSEKNLRRHRRESRRINRALGRRTERRHWAVPFHPPIRRTKFGPGDSFGSRRVINGKPRSPHSGEDYEATVGDPVFAINHGRVVLTGEFFFSGKGVFVDHGHGLTSMYFHLSKITVEEGQIVRSGEQLGEAGATGRVTGPHLHLGIQWRNARVDPDRFFFENNWLVETKGVQHHQ